MVALSVRFQALPGSPLPRPVLAVNLERSLRAPLACLVDTGSLHNRMPGWLAARAGIDLSDTEPDPSIALGGLVGVTPRTVRCTLEVGPFEWEAPVSFCEPWPDVHFGLLGQEGFLRYFRVEFRAARDELRLEPEAGIA